MRILIVSLCVCLLCVPALAERALIGKGDVFPRQFLETPLLERDRLYLGLEAAESFLLEEIAADVVMVEILNVHCPHCQRQALAYNELFDLIEEDPRTRGRIKILGVAAGNGWREVEGFAEIYEVAFPVIPDPQFRLHRAIGQSRTPFTIYVRQRKPGHSGVVAATRLGIDNRFRKIHGLLREMMDAPPSVFLEDAGERPRLAATARPIMSDEELEDEIWQSFAGLGDELVDVRRVPIKADRTIYTAMIEDGGAARRYFAEVVSRPSVCDVCHDLHFIYVFDRKGRVVRFIPLRLTKYGNKEWSREDVDHMRRRVVGRYLGAPWRFDSEVDTVTSATITSAIIFDSLARGEELMAELQAQGLL